MKTSVDNGHFGLGEDWNMPQTPQPQDAAKYRQENGLLKQQIKQLQMDLQSEQGNFHISSFKSE